MWGEPLVAPMVPCAGRHLGSAGLTCEDFPMCRGGLRQGIVVTHTEPLHTQKGAGGRAPCGPTARLLRSPACLPLSTKHQGPWGFSPLPSWRRLSPRFPAPGAVASPLPGCRTISCNTGML